MSLPFVDNYKRIRSSFGITTKGHVQRIPTASELDALKREQIAALTRKQHAELDATKLYEIKEEQRLRGEQIINDILFQRNVKLDDLRRFTKSKVIVQIRKELCYRLFVEARWSYTRIAAILGKTHSVAVHYVRLYCDENNIATDDNGEIVL